MQIDNKALVLDFIEWVGRRPRSYAEAMEAWRTSCPRLTIWEDTMDLGLVACQRRSDAETVVVLTDKGRSLLERERP